LSTLIATVVESIYAAFNISNYAAVLTTIG
jgi:hypothetical protein